MPQRIVLSIYLGCSEFSAAGNICRTAPSSSVQVTLPHSCHHCAAWRSALSFCSVSAHGHRKSRVRSNNTLTRKVYVTLIYLLLFAVELLCCDMLWYSCTGQYALCYALLTFADNTCLLDVSLHRIIISINFPLIYAIWWPLIIVRGSAGRYTGSYRIPVFIFLTIWILKIPQYRYYLNNVWNATLLERGLFSQLHFGEDTAVCVTKRESSETEALVECDEREEVHPQYPHRPPQISNIRCISSRVSHKLKFSVDTTDSRQLQGSRLLKFTFHNFKAVNTLTFLK